MAMFKDSIGREWLVKVTVDAIEKVREIGVDLGDISAATIRQLALDDVLLVRTLWLICEPQADTKGITPETFGEAMCGDPLEEAFEALRRSLDDFFPSRKRQFWRKAVEAELKTQANAMEIGMEAMSDPALQSKTAEAMRNRVKEEIQKSLKQLSAATDSPDSLE